MTTDYLCGASDYIGPAEEKIGERTQLTQKSIDALSAIDVDKELLNRFVQSAYLPELVSNVFTYADSVVPDNASFAVDLLDATESLKHKISSGEDVSGTLEELTSLSHRIYNTFKNGGSNTIEADMLENIKKLAVGIANEMKNANSEGDNNGDRS